MYYVYWIRYEDHTNPNWDGYVGITNDPESRFRYHSNKASSDNPILHSAIQKGAQMEIIASVTTKQQALAIEEQFRPANNMGWNIIRGGSAPPSQLGRTFNADNYPNFGMRNKRHTVERNNRMSAIISAKRWYNNGKTNKRLGETDIIPSGYRPGKLSPGKYNLSEAAKSRMGKAGKAIVTPHGEFKTLSEAAKALNMTWDQIQWRVKKDKYPDWHYKKSGPKAA